MGQEELAGKDSAVAPPGSNLPAWDSGFPRLFSSWRWELHPSRVRRGRKAGVQHLLQPRRAGPCCRRVKGPSLRCPGAPTAALRPPTGPAALLSGDQRVQVAKSKAQQNHALLERELQRRKEQLRAPAVLPGVRIKEEPVSEEGEDEEDREAEEDEEPMDTSLGGGLHNRLANGLPSGRAAGGDSFNGHPPPGCASAPVAQELRAFVEATFQRQFVLTLSELKRLFNLHLASLPPGHTLFSGISDRMLQDTVLAAGCKQILVPVSRARRASGWADTRGRPLPLRRAPGTRHLSRQEGKWGTLWSGLRPACFGGTSCLEAAWELGRSVGLCLNWFSRVGFV